MLPWLSALERRLERTSTRISELESDALAKARARATVRGITFAESKGYSAGANCSGSAAGSAGAAHSSKHNYTRAPQNTQVSKAAKLSAITAEVERHRNRLGPTAVEILSDLERAKRVVTELENQLSGPGKTSAGKERRVVEGGGRESERVVGSDGNSGVKGAGEMRRSLTTGSLVPWRG